jgi:biopolymer transport protein ExbB/TolQ
MKRKLTIAGIVIGAILALGPMWGMIATVFAMQRVFASFGEAGYTDPHAISSPIAAALSYQTFGLIACPIGIALCVFSILKFVAMGRQPPPVPPPAQESSDSKA